MSDDTPDLPPRADWEPDIMMRRLAASEHPYGEYGPWDATHIEVYQRDAAAMVATFDHLRAELEQARARVAPPACERESVTPTDDGVLIVDCSVHGEVDQIYTGGTLDRIGENETRALLESRWARHVTGAAAAAEGTRQALHALSDRLLAQRDRVRNDGRRSATRSYGLEEAATMARLFATELTMPGQDVIA